MFEFVVGLGMAKQYKLDNKREFLVQGSTPIPYKVVFTKNGDNLTARCSCKAGIHGMHCKHRINILKGDVKGIVSQNEEDVEVVVSWLPGSDVEAVFNELDVAEAEYKKVNEKFKAVKKSLARALLD